MLKQTKGNLLDLAEQGEFDVIVHGCNCQNTMGSGIAREIRERYPRAYAADTAYSQAMSYHGTDYGKLGNFSVEVAAPRKDPNHHPFVIVNAYTQYHYLPRDHDHFEYSAFELILQKLEHQYGARKIGFPYIGCGLAGGDKDRIIAMLEAFADKVSAQGGSVTLVSYEP
jgi:O-acetyl-ADP-ribose deacetylase (regulator of RNase III)